MYQSQSTVMALRTLSVPVLFTVDPNQGTENARPISDCGVKTDVSTRLADLDNRITDLEDIIDLFDPTTQDQSCTPALATVTQTLATEGYSKSSCGSGENNIGSKEAEFKFAAAGGCVTASVTKVKCQRPVVITEYGGDGKKRGLTTSGGRREGESVNDYIDRVQNGAAENFENGHYQPYNSCETVIFDVCID